MGRLLDGIRVLDLTNVLAGPYCCYQLALLGADVIKIEHPDGGDLARQLGADSALNAKKMGASFLAQNAGKRSMTLNFKSEEGKRLFLELVQQSDVVVENFRSDVMKRLGFDYQSLKKVNPGIVYCSISGFGASGPLATHPAYDQIIQGMSGVMSITGDEKSAPTRVGYPICDTIGGLTAAFAVVSALFKRTQENIGEFIDVSMLEATLSTMGWPISNWLIAGVEPVAMGNQNFTAAPSGTFSTQHGLINISANQQIQFEKLCHALGLVHLLTDPRFESRESRKKNRELLNEQLESVLSSDTAKRWAIRLNEMGVPSGEVLDVPEVLDHRQLRDRDFIQHLNSSDGTKVKVVRGGYLLSSGAPKVSLPPPVLGEHTAEVLQTILNISKPEQEKLKSLNII